MSEVTAGQFPWLWRERFWIFFFSCPWLCSPALPQHLLHPAMTISFPAHLCCKTNSSSRTATFPTWNATYAAKAPAEALQWAVRLTKTYGSHTPQQEQTSQKPGVKKKWGKSGHSNKTSPLLQVWSTQPDVYKPAENSAFTKTRSFLPGEGEKGETVGQGGVSLQTFPPSSAAVTSEEQPQHLPLLIYSPALNNSLANIYNKAANYGSG